MHGRVAYTQLICKQACGLNPWPMTNAKIKGSHWAQDRFKHMWLHTLRMF